MRNVPHRYRHLNTCFPVDGIVSEDLQDTRHKVASRSITLNVDFGRVNSFFSVKFIYFNLNWSYPPSFFPTLSPTSLPMSSPKLLLLCFCWERVRPHHVCQQSMACQVELRLSYSPWIKAKLVNTVLEIRYWKTPKALRTGFVIIFWSLTSRSRYTTDTHVEGIG